MISITVDDIRAAQSNDLEATARIIEATEERVTRLANRAAFRMAATGNRLETMREELEQVGRIAVWEALPRFTGDSVDTFFAFMHNTIATKLTDAVRAERNGAAGVDKDATKTFGAVLRDMANGDVLLAERMCQTDLPSGQRLSADRANAARIAWQGSVSIYAPATPGNADEYGFADMLVAAPDETHKVQAKVGAGAALEALSVLHRYTTAYEVLAALPTAPEDVDAIEDTLTVPRDPDVRRYVLDAVRILRSFVSTSTEADLDETLRDASDNRRDQRAVKQDNVKAALNRMGAGQRAVLVHSFGIGGADDFGWGDSGSLEGLADFLGITTANTKVQRTKARQAFARYYIVIVATDDDDAQEWADAAAHMRKPAGRK